MILIGKRFTSYILAQICFFLPLLNTKIYFCQLIISSPHKRASKQEDFKNQLECFCACPSQRDSLPPLSLHSRRVEVSVLDVLFHFGQLTGVQGGVREGGVHPRQPQTGHEDVYEAGQHQVPVKSCAFQQPGAENQLFQAGSWWKMQRYFWGRGLTCVLVHA